MRFLHRVPPWVLGVSATVIIVVVVLMYGNDDRSESAEVDTPVSKVAVAESDPPNLRISKESLHASIRAYVRAFHSRKPGMSYIDYVDRITPFEDPEHLRMFESYISSDVQRRYIEQRETVKVIDLRKPEGELYGEDGSLRFEGIVYFKLVRITDGERSVLMPPTEYHLHMSEARENWRATYFSPVTE